MEKLKVDVDGEEREAWVCDPCGWAHIDESHHFAVDIPNHSNLEGEYVNLGYFRTREEAVEWAKERLGADDEGWIQVVTELP